VKIELNKISKFAFIILGFSIVFPVSAGDENSSPEFGNREHIYYRPLDMRDREKIPTKAIALETEALDLLNSRKYREAIKKYTLSLKEYPKNGSALTNRALCYRAIGEFDKAVADYKSAFSISPALKKLSGQLLADMYLERGQNRIDQGNLIGATSDLNEAAKSPYVKPQALSEIAYIAMLRKDFAECVNIADQATLLSPEFTNPRITKGACLIASGKYRSAVDALDSAISINPNIANAFLNRAVAHVHLSNCEAAAKDGAKVVSLDGSMTDVVRQIVTSCK